jgi:hypothetical protein
VTGPSIRREMAGKAVAMDGVSIPLACRTFCVSETCYRYSARLNDDNEQIADLLIGLTRAKKNRGIAGLDFPIIFARKTFPSSKPRDGTILDANASAGADAALSAVDAWSIHLACMAGLQGRSTTHKPQLRY